MRSLLAIDIGNTNIAAGIFQKGRLIKKFNLPTLKAASLAAISEIQRYKAKRIIISSVVPVALKKLEKGLRKAGGDELFILGRNLKVPITNLYKVKKQVGQDRLVNAFAAKSLYGAPAVIVDFGTAMTFDIVSRKGEYAGGLILPGIEMGLRSLYEKTALLPRVKLKAAGSIIGKDTVSSMRGGILFGYGAMCDSLTASYRRILGKRMKVVATGGNAPLVKKYTKSLQIIDEDLTLKGLYLLYSTR